MIANNLVKENLAARWDTVRRAIDAAAQQAGRQPDSVRLVAVSKTHPVAAMRAALAAGAHDFGENRVQEAESKILELGRNKAYWHLIGPLQANKARKAVRLFDMIHSLDSLALANRLERFCGEDGRAGLPVFVQVELGGEPTKSGVTEADLPALAEMLLSCKHLRWQGLMTLPPYQEDPEQVRPYFRRLRELRDEWRQRGAFNGQEGELSMGMSHDFAAAIAEGATIVRVGTAIFGERQVAHETNNPQMDTDKDKNSYLFPSTDNS